MIVLLLSSQQKAVVLTSAILLDSRVRGNDYFGEGGVVTRTTYLHLLPPP